MISIVLCFVGFLVRFYTIATSAKDTSGRNTKQQVANSLNTKGIYSIIRHPLYFGNYMKELCFAEERFLERKFKNILYVGLIQYLLSFHYH